MRIPRYFQQEQYSNQSALVPLPQRFVSPLEEVGKSLSPILENLSDQAQRNYMAEESAKAQAKIFEVADQVEQDIAAEKILDEREVEETFRTRVDEAFEELQITPKVRKSIQPEITRLMSINGLNLSRSLQKKRGELEVNSLNNSIQTFARTAIEAGSTEELNDSLKIIRDTVDRVEGTFLSTSQKSQYLSGIYDEIHSARIERALQNPGVDPQDIQDYLQAQKENISVGTFEKLNATVESRIQDDVKNDIYYGIVDQIERAGKDGSALDSIRTEINSHRDIFPIGMISRLQSEVDQVENRRRVENAQVSADEIDLVVNQINRALAIDNDPGQALGILNKNRSLFDQDKYDDELLKIDLAKNSQAEQSDQSRQKSNVEFFEYKIGIGEYDDLSIDKFTDTLDSEIHLNRNISIDDRPRILNSFFTRQIKRGEEKITTQNALRKVQDGQYLDQKETDLVYKNVHMANANIDDPDWINKEVIFSAKTAKNIPTDWLDYTKSAILLEPNSENMKAIDQAAQYTTSLSKMNPGVFANLDKDVRSLLPIYWDRAGRVSGMSDDKKADIWKNLLKTKYSPNRERVDAITSSSGFRDTVDTYWDQAWSWYGKFAPEQMNTQAEYFRNEPNLPDILKLNWEEKFRDQLAATTGEDGIPNFERASEYAFNELFQTWGLTEAYGTLRWQYQPIDKYIRNTPFSFEDVASFIDGEIAKELGKNVIHKEMNLPGIGANFSYDPQGEMIDISQVTLEYMPDSEKNNPVSGFPDYYILIDGDTQPAGNGWAGIKGDELFKYLKDKAKTKNIRELKFWERERESWNPGMDYLKNVLSTQTGSLRSEITGK